MISHVTEENSDVTGKNTIEHNPTWPKILYCSCRILMVGYCGSRKTNALLNLTNLQPDIDKTYFYAKDSYEAKY